MLWLLAFNWILPVYYNLPREPQFSSFRIILQLFTGSSSSLAEQVLHSKCICFCVFLDCGSNQVNVFRPDYWKGAQMMCMLANGQLREVSTFREREGERRRDRVLELTVNFGVSTRDGSTQWRSGGNRGSNNEWKQYFSRLSLPPVALSQLLTIMLSCLIYVMWVM